ncbi:MAG: NAD(+)/NADH kinase [Verrucomicrobia bacterium]|nr:NAD(+)/NADH kinase [Verrucomicrobiota bacterium]
MMNFSKTIIVPKMSKYEWDMTRHRLTSRQLIAKYRRQGVDISRILESHERQQQSLRILREMFPARHFVSREGFTRDIAERAQWVIAHGGDNHFQYVSHFVENAVMIGINSDTVRSEGALTLFSAETFRQTAASLHARDIPVQEWARLQIVINRTRVRSPAISEIFLGESLRSQMSRHVLVHGKAREEQKCSGLIVATGAGSTGWYQSASCRLHDARAFPKTEKLFKFVVTEPYQGHSVHCLHPHGTVRTGEELKIVSLNDSRGILSIDALEEHPFHEGSVARIRLGKPLRVLIPLRPRFLKLRAELRK